jgi:hypothetical protein
MSTSVLAGELSSKQDGIEKPETHIEQPLFLAAKDSVSGSTSKAPATMGGCCFSPYSTLFVGASYSYVCLKPTDLPQYSGNLWGALAGYQYRKQDGLYVALKGLWRQGDTSGKSGQNYLHECKAEERVGYDFSFGPFQRGSAALYMGFGYRFMEQELQQPALPNVSLAYNNFYVPIGTSIDYAIPFQNSCLSLGICATWMPQVYPTVNIIPLGGARWILEYELVNGIVEIPVTFSYCNSFSVTLRPVFEYWKDGATVAVGSLCDALGLPASSYLFGSVNLEVGWRF